MEVLGLKSKITETKKKKNPKKPLDDPSQSTRDGRRVSKLEDRSYKLFILKKEKD